MEIQYIDKTSKDELFKYTIYTKGGLYLKCNLKIPMNFTYSTASTYSFFNRLYSL